MWRATQVIDWLERLYIGLVGVCLAVIVMRNFPLGPQLISLGEPEGSFKDDPVCERLVSWILEHGGAADGVRCVDMAEKGGRGLVTTKPISYRELYIKVPRSTWMMEYTVKEHSPVGTILDSDPELKKSCGDFWGATDEPYRLALALMYELGNPDSYWKPYIDSLPEIGTPHMWSEEELAKLESTVMIEKVQNDVDTAREMYGKFFPYLSEQYPEFYPKNSSTFELYHRAMLLIWSRSFDASAADPTDTVRDPERRTWILVPYGDLVNHETHLESFYGKHSDLYGDLEPGEKPTYEAQLEAVGKPWDLWANECAKAGQEVYQSYGSHKSTAGFVYYYGFVPAGFISSDFVSFVSVLDEGKGAVGFAGIDGHITENFITNITRSLQKAGFLEDGLNSTEKSREALRWIHQYVLRQQSSIYTTTYDEDVAMMHSATIPYPGRVAAAARSRAKMILIKVLENLEYRIASDAPGNASSWKSKELPYLMAYEMDEDRTTDASLLSIQIPVLKVTRAALQRLNSAADRLKSGQNDLVVGEV